MIPFGISYELANGIQLLQQLRRLPTVGVYGYIGIRETEYGTIYSGSLRTHSFQTRTERTPGRCRDSLWLTAIAQNPTVRKKIRRLGELSLSASFCSQKLLIQKKFIVGSTVDVSFTPCYHHFFPVLFVLCKSFHCSCSYLSLESINHELY